MSQSVELDGLLTERTRADSNATNCRLDNMFARELVKAVNFDEQGVVAGALTAMSAENQKPQRSILDDPMVLNCW